MAKERGWWNIEFTVTPSQCDLDHIGELVKRGFLSGIIEEDEEDEPDE
jgi:hypothetical protein